MIEQLLAALTLAVCVLLLLRLAIGERRRWWLDAALQRRWSALQGLARRPARLLRRRREAQAQARAETEAARAADALIRRVKRDVEREGNVIRPSAFLRPHDDRERDEPRKPH